MAAAGGTPPADEYPESSGGDSGRRGIPVRSPGEGPGRRLILVGLDAADERWIRAGVASGALPSFGRMIREGSWGPLATHPPILSPIIWTSMATGLTPDRHGVLDFVETDSRGVTVPVTVRSRRVPAVWNILGGKGIPCGIVGWLATYPAERVNGFVVSDRFTIHPYGRPEPAKTGDPTGKTFPPELYGSLQGALVEPSSITDSDLRAAFGAPSVPAGEDVTERRELRVIEAVARTYTDVALRLDRQRRPAFLAVYFEAIDRLMHLFGSLAPPPLPGAPPEKARRYGGAIDRFYVAMDARLGRFLDEAGEEGTVLVVSDHGFKTGSERPRHAPLRSDVFAAEWHRDPGVVLAWGRGVRRGGRIDGADIYDVTPTILAYFGLPASETMRGRPMTDLFVPGFLQPPQPPVPSYETAAAAPTEPTPPAPREDERAILENLRALGYVGGGGAGTGLRASTNLATFYLGEKQYERAVALYREVLSKDPKDLTVLYNLGYAYKGLGSHARAAECFEQLLRERPDYMEARLVLSDCYVSLGRSEAALALLEEKQSEGRSDPGYQNHLGTVLASAGRLDGAIAAFERAIVLRPGEASPYLNLARVRLGRNDRKGAMETLRRAQRALPGDARVEARIQELARGER